VLYHFVKPVIRLALLFFCRKISFNRRDYFKCRGPMILAVNHPNSFFDAVITGVFFKQPVYFLARGDAFKKSWALKILTGLKCIPVYRLREGKENLHLNEDSFERCRQVLRKGGIVLIFSEGLCINEWNIRPLRKGTARLAFSSWNDTTIGDTLRVLPVGLNYNSFNRFGKKVFVRFGEMITRTDIDTSLNEGAAFVAFNQLLAAQLETLCFNGVPNTQPANRVFSFITNNITGKQQFEQLKRISSNIAHNENLNSESFTAISNHYHCAFTPSQSRKSFFIAGVTAPFALVGWLTSGWFYTALKKWVLRKNGELGHHDSIVFTALALFYPIYVLLLALVGWIVSGRWQVFLLIFAAIPLCACTLTIFLPNWQRFWNYNRLKTEQRISLQRFIKETHL
jgi:1-acyl-sn-glycerol-3-phosphate acyltransferase